MVPREVEFAIEITPNDRYRRRHRSQKGRILNFVVQYETKIGDRWYPVVRYDTAHGFFHRDLMRPGKNVQKTPLYENDLNKALTRSEADIKERWQSYKATFLKELEKHES